MRKMNEEERKLVSENHGLIGGFCNQYKLDYDEMYGMLAEALCLAGMTWEEEKGAFSTYSYKCMRNKLLTYYKEEGCQKRKANQYIVSLNSIDKNMSYNLGETVEYMDSIFADTDVEEEATVEVMKEYYFNLMTERQRYVVEGLLKEKTVQQIADEMGVTKQALNQLLNNMREKLSLVLTFEEYCDILKK